MPMSACFEGGGVVDAVAGHGDHVAAALQGAHQTQLLLRLDAGEDIHGHGRPRPAPRRRALGQLAAGQRPAGGTEADLPGNGERRARRGRR
jgi:hypothetical protein